MTVRSNKKTPPLGLILIFLLSGCASLAPPVERDLQTTPAVANDTELDRVIAATLAPFPGNSGAHFLKDGLDAFAARLAGADRASRSIDAQYYLFHDDVTGRLLAHRLLSAANRGVEVRLLLDDIGARGRDSDFLALDAHPNIDVRIFNPFANRRFRLFEYLYRFGVVTRRMHNKSMIIDGVVAIAGGRNVGDEYYDAHEASNFLDMDVMVFGSAVEDISGQYDEYWNSRFSYSIGELAKKQMTRDEAGAGWAQLAQYAEMQKDGVYLTRLRETPFFDHLQAGTLPVVIAPALVLSDRPEKIHLPLEDDSTHLGPALWPLFRQVSEELLILNPYFIPGHDGVAALAEAVSRGGRVIVLTNSLASNDVAIVHGHYAKYRKPLLRAGVEIYELKVDRPGINSSDLGTEADESHMSLHVKTFIFDRKKTFIGSLNLDPRSVYQNTELGVIVEDIGMAEEIAVITLDRLPDIAYQVGLDESDRLFWLGRDPDTHEMTRYHREPEAGIFQRILAAVSRVLPVEGQL
ncbi:MAG: phospholipase D family protein [Arenicellales bacterium]|nr:phospholipase D family protein [Arenicellales bacterium]